MNRVARALINRSTPITIANLIVIGIGIAFGFVLVRGMEIKIRNAVIEAHEIMRETGQKAER